MIADEIAKEIFENIRDLPYRVTEFVGDDCPNCFNKGTKLMHELGVMGYAVRGQTAEIRWEDTPLPKEIVALHPKDILATHFYIEIEQNGIWRALDATWDKALEKIGCPIAEWDGRNSPAFPLVKKYTLEEQAAYLELCKNPAFINDYYDRAGDFLRKANQWFAQVRE